MCGICGFAAFSGVRPDQESLRRARDVMALRGPDASGMFWDEQAGLAHRRLKILDLSEGANQPLGNEDGSIQVVFNGEVYNFQELRQQLAEAGHQFVTTTDTEILVHGYEEWGEELVAKLDGMFAFGLWDQPRRVLLVARDRLGQKPLFLAERNGAVYFASDIRCFPPFGFPVEIDPCAVDCYLQHFSPTQDHTILKGVGKLRPGEYAVFSREGRRSVCYWKPDFREKLSLSEEEWLDRIDETLDRAVAKRLVSDVPLGFFLSGGVDSSLVVAYAARHMQKPMTFSIGFEESSFSELQYAKMVAERHGTDHHEIILKPNILDVLTKLLAEYGEPFADASGLPTYFVSQAARTKVTVALSGDGGDELFGGYRFYAAAYWAARMRSVVPGWGVRSLHRLFGQTSDSAAGSALFGKFQTVLGYAHPDLRTRRRNTMGFNLHQKQRLYTDEMRALLGSHSPHHIYDHYQAETESLGLVDEALYHGLVGRLPNDYLIKVDVASMANSLELRSPFLDRDLLALSQQIPPNVKIPKGDRKHLLKKLAERHLPWETIYRPKQGFELPVSSWLRTEWATLVRTMLLEGRLLSTGWFAGDYVREIVQQHQSGARDHTYRIWSLFCLELWYRLFVDHSLQAGDNLAGL
jgi:asparagine synthase (glutamine-hydrolysing)